MATINSVQIATGAPIAGVGMGGGQVKEAYSLTAVPVGATTADVLPLFYIPPHSAVRSVTLKTDALGGAFTISIGDTGVGTAIAASSTRYVATQSLATATSANAIALTGLFFRNTTSRKLLVQAVGLSGTTTTAGNLEVSITYVTEEPQQ